MRTAAMDLAIYLQREIAKAENESGLTLGEAAAVQFLMALDAEQLEHVLKERAAAQERGDGDERRDGKKMHRFDVTHGRASFPS